MMLPELAATFKFIKNFATHLKWASDFILRQSFSFPQIISPATTPDHVFSDEMGLIRLRNGSCREGCNGGRGEEECSICLLKFEEGVEIRELNCGHYFHRVCLDKWVGHGQVTCPLCRNYLRLPPIVADFHQELLLFKFCKFGSSDRDSDSWWLR